MLYKEYIGYRIIEETLNRLLVHNRLWKIVIAAVDWM